MDSHPAKEKAGNVSSIRLTARLTPRHLPACLGVADVGAASGAQCLGQCTQFSTGTHSTYVRKGGRWQRPRSSCEMDRAVSWREGKMGKHRGQLRTLGGI